MLVALLLEVDDRPAQDRHVLFGFLVFDLLVRAVALDLALG